MGFLSDDKIKFFIKNLIDHISFKNLNKKIIYIPHPRESGKEIKFFQKILGSKMILCTKYISAEHFLIENTNIDKTYSIGSTASLSSYQMGYKSYVFYKMLKIDKSKVQAFENVLSSMPEESNIKNLILKRLFNC